ncbi:hypothetical protein H7X87_04410 [Acetobacteraceae bacterium]|nr:hypothetical protein [Candidatus Parcubacteria bacterium]
MPVHAQTGGDLRQYQPLEPLGDVYKTSDEVSFQNLLVFTFKILFTIGGIIAAVSIILGGITIMFSEVANKRSEAKERIWAAMWALGILITSWLILNTINPNLLNFQFTLTDVASVPTNPTGSSNGEGFRWKEFASDEDFLLVGKAYGCPNKIWTGLPDGCVYNKILLYQTSLANTPEVLAARAQYEQECHGSWWTPRIWVTDRMPASFVGEDNNTTQALACINPAAVNLVKAYWPFGF